MSKERGKTTAGISWPDWMPRGLKHQLRNVESIGVTCSYLPGFEDPANDMLGQLDLFRAELEADHPSVESIARYLAAAMSVKARLSRMLESDDGGVAA